LLSPGIAAADTLPVTVGFQAFEPSLIDALPGDTVTWTNNSERVHTVTADGGQFDSGEIGHGVHFAQAFTTVGDYLYHCTLHRGMVGEVNVRRVTLNPVPSGLLPRSSRLVVDGRTADLGAPVRIERDTGSGFQTVATTFPHPDGTWTVRVAATRTARLRAAVDGDTSRIRRIRVIDKTVRINATRTGISVTVMPRAPHARVVLQLFLRDRFGWWPTSVARLDRLSRATFHVYGSVRARVALVGRDGWTPLALSRVVRLHRSLRDTRSPKQRTML
jgi:hypothetical protein